MKANTPAQQFGYKAKLTILTSAPAAGLVWSLHIPRVSDLSCVLSEQLLVESKSHNNQHFTWPKYKYAISLLANPWQQQQKKKNHTFSAEGKTSERHLIQTEIESGVVEAAENESLIVSHQREKRLLWMASIQKWTQNQDRSLCLNTGVKDTIKAEVRLLLQLKQCHIYSQSCQRLGVILGPSLWIPLVLHTAKHREKWRALYIQFITGILWE